MMLIPAADRPFVGSTTNNSWFSLIFGYNGLSRLTGGGSGGGSGGFGGFGSSTGPLRLFTGAGVGGQIGWLLPLALVGLLAGVWVTRRAGRQDRRRAALIMFGLWALAGFVVFSFSQGTFHPYYTSAMAPAVAALAAGGAVILFDRVRAGWGWAGLLALAVGVSAIVSFLLLNDTPSFVPWLRWAILVAAAVVILAVAVAALRMGDRLPRGALVGVAIGGSALALLGGPTAYSLATIGHGQTGSNPTAGPSSADSAGFGRFGGSASARFADATRSLGPRSLGPRSLGPPSLGAGAGAARFSRAGRGGAGTNTANPALVRYLEAHRDGAKYLVAASGSQTAAPIELATHDDVITLGGFNGSDPAPTVAQVRTLVADGELRWILVGGGFGDFGGFTGGDGRSSSSEAATGTSGIGALFGAGTTRATTGGGFAARGGSSETAALTQWVEAHCQSVTVPGESSASSTGSGGAGASRGGELYACTREDAAGAAK
jgi:4-amino-4-deoxy-L-arabinose transferase-like glycosyltransferase